MDGPNNFPPNSSLPSFRHSSVVAPCVWAPIACAPQLRPAPAPNVSWPAGESWREWNGCKCRRLVLAEEWECGGRGQLTPWTPITGSFNPGLGSDTIPDTFWAQTTLVLWPTSLTTLAMVHGELRLGFLFSWNSPLLLKFQSKTWILHKRQQQQPGTWWTFCAQVNSVIPYLRGHKVSTAVSTPPAVVNCNHPRISDSLIYSLMSIAFQNTILHNSPKVHFIQIRR